MHAPTPETAARGRPKPDPGLPGKAAPERLLQRLDWTVIRRLDGVLQGNCCID